ncbi:Zn-ribbon domain-containing OB-fold protein [Bradyrhizobium sp. AUGA SZCCT0182]|uniref:Zn-ribbon domain-containing OB-fold protein n=1 Tax=Bradyrhizobium sp. AUGA SZCCT0182 TaxID=2807667 RepID=UPI001BA8A6F9|nr:Zn-ribbon domain-containing OB-fold protein [Bradyrhizobium sp. AUGA SZCCT0182]MBR1235866.1 Zn-ribbon domain-containing OB-fold protein [Bradyrhizobium sp. AUGA SZCCT0182]
MAEEKAGRPIPKASVYVDTKPFWDGTKVGKLVLQYCKDTGQFQHYPRPVSIFTGSRNLEWREVSGKGTIYACTVIRVPGPGLDGRLPLSVATVQLEEGVRILGNILNKDADTVKIGQRVEVAWDRLSDDVQYPAFNVV